MTIAELTCRLKGHLWKGSGSLPDLPTTGGSYIIHRRCRRCGKYEKLPRQAARIEE